MFKEGDRVNCRGNDPITPGTVVRFDDDPVHGGYAIQWDDGYQDECLWSPDELDRLEDA